MPDYKFKDREDGYKFLKDLSFDVLVFSVVPVGSNTHVASLWDDGGLDFAPSFDEFVVGYQNRIREALCLPKDETYRT